MAQTRSYPVRTEAGVLPNLVIAGVMKAGTTSLHTYMAQHPEVCASSKKETCYFLPLRYDKPIAPIEQYHFNFKHYSGERYAMEATPGYFDGGRKVAQAIRSTLGPTRVMIVLREPVERLFSFYHFEKAMFFLDSEIDFDRYIELCVAMPEEQVRIQTNHKFWGVRGGFYTDYLEEWYDVFGDDLRVYFFDELKREPLALLNKIYTWLGIEPFIPPALTVENKTVNYKNAFLHKAALQWNRKFERFLRSYPFLKDALRRVYFHFNGQPFEERMSQKARTCLQAIYAPYNQRLAALLHRRSYTNLPDWLAPAATSSQR
ncbi:sulfotransferase domain-containing protein [Gloeobacter violaceus]|uniref:Gll2193 protein n=1 Tax=Gloeobacter violaceus (strain ATCC 29082 / PCC 7421) TaxID=251221 RepID=Q7NIJ0_GLOVI|nr:sulfotransferase domain-containing protein [Gloeobacter violaceus]BAC90134.1 gll2193 [Gloeobacter violaceus PCC 7421]